MEKCLIISGGEYSLPGIPFDEFNMIIACDKGYVYAEQMGVKPDLIIGDFDSAPKIETGENVRVYSSIKDDTDTMLAVKYALEKGYKDIWICCALGGRLDHLMANIQSGAYIANAGGRAHITGENEIVTVMPSGQIEFEKKDGWSLSCFAITDICKGLNIKGAKYEVSDGELTNTFPLGVSNKWKEDKVSVSFSEGIMMFIESKLKEGEYI